MFRVEESQVHPNMNGASQKPPQCVKTENQSSWKRGLGLSAACRPRTPWIWAIKPLPLAISGPGERASKLEACWVEQFCTSASDRL